MIIVRYLKRFDVDPNRTVMVGDQMSDHVAASHAGVGFIGVGDQAPDLDATVAMIGDLTELDQALREVFGGPDCR